jgi:hydroxymethylglutaryl-CoA lyase
MRHIEFVEVGPRDGLQNEAAAVSTDNKLTLINHAVAAGARRIEVTSFVNPNRVPQMADAEAVSAGLPVRDDVTYIGLVMNGRGAERAIATGRIDQLGAVCVATDRFAMANQGQTSDESVAVAKTIVRRAQDAGLSGQVTIAASFGCPFEGEVDEDRVIAIATSLAQAPNRDWTRRHNWRWKSGPCRAARGAGSRRHRPDSGSRPFSQHARHRPRQCMGRC